MECSLVTLVTSHCYFRSVRQTQFFKAHTSNTTQGQRATCRGGALDPKEMAAGSRQPGPHPGSGQPGISCVCSLPGPAAGRS